MKPYFSVIDSTCQDFDRIKQAFNDLIKPVYGSQTSALEKIGAGHDRLCEGLYVDNQLQGMLVYKKQITPDDKSLEIKTLALVNPGHESGKGLGSVLFERAVLIAAQRNATHLSLTVSSKKPDALGFFQKKGFKITESIQDRYSVGAIEHSLSYDLPTHQLAIAPLPSRAAASSSASASSSAHVIPFRREEASQNHRKRQRSDHEEGAAAAYTHSNHTERRFVTPYNNNRNTEYRGCFFERGAQQHQCSLRNQYIQLIKGGQKTYEGRVNTRLFQEYSVGDTVTWSAGSSQVTTRITDRRRYPSFEAMLSDIGYKKMVPDAQSLEHAVSIYNNIPGYQEKAARFGVVAMGVQVCEPQHTSSASAAASSSSSSSSHAQSSMR